MPRRSTLICLLFWFASLALRFSPLAFAQQLPDSQYAPILIPLSTNSPIHGAFGTVWTATVTAYNSSDQPVAYVGGSCPLGVFCPGPRLWPPRSYETPIHYSGHAGYLLWVDRSAEAKIHLSVRLNEQTAGFQPAADLPVIRERNLYKGSLQILEVPLRPDARLALRIYTVERSAGASSSVFRVTSFSRDDVVLGELHVTTVNPFPSSLPPFPGYAYIDLSVAFPPAAASNARLEISTEDADLTFWAFVTVTDNITQQVLVLNPS